MEQGPPDASLIGDEKAVHAELGKIVRLDLFTDDNRQVYTGVQLLSDDIRPLADLFLGKYQRPMDVKASRDGFLLPCQIVGALPGPPVARVYRANTIHALKIAKAQRPELQERLPIHRKVAARKRTQM